MEEEAKAVGGQVGAGMVVDLEEVGVMVLVVERAAVMVMVECLEMAPEVAVVMVAARGATVEVGCIELSGQQNGSPSHLDRADLGPYMRP
jgi:hypothetical protein